MPRRRSRAVFKSELPVRVQSVEEFVDGVTSAAFHLIPDPDGEAVIRLAIIARNYHDDRRIEAQRASRPDSRKSLEKVAVLAARLLDLVRLLPEEVRAVFGHQIRDDLISPGRAIQPYEIGYALAELGDLEAGRWFPEDADEFGQQLSKFHDALRELVSCCTNLPQSAEWALIELQNHATLLPPEIDDRERLPALFDGLSAFASTASQVSKADRGPRSDTVQMRAVLALKAEFERSGQNASHNCKKQRHYTGESNSPFGMFVHAFFAQVEKQQLLRRGLDDAIAFACWPSRAGARRPAVEAGAAGRDRLIARLLKGKGVTYNSAPH